MSTDSLYYFLFSLNYFIDLFLVNVCKSRTVYYLNKINKTISNWAYLSENPHAGHSNLK